MEATCQSVWNDPYVPRNVSNRIDTNEQIELALPEQHFGLEMRGLHGGEERG
jgi:hypothetical protein